MGVGGVVVVLGVGGATPGIGGLDAMGVEFGVGVVAAEEDSGRIRLGGFRSGTPKVGSGCGAESMVADEPARNESVVGKVFLLAGPCALRLTEAAVVSVAGEKEVLGWKFELVLIAGVDLAESLIVTCEASLSFP